MLAPMRIALRDCSFNKQQIDQLDQKITSTRSAVKTKLSTKLKLATINTMNKKEIISFFWCYFYRAKALPNKHTLTKKSQCVYPEPIKDSNGH
jgi:hypothetical protein